MQQQTQASPQVLALTKQWGWTSPPPQVLAMATQTLAAMESQPPADASNAYARAMAAGLPVFEQLHLLTQHDALRRPDVATYAEKHDALVMLIEGSVPVVLFATFEQLMAFQQEGRADAARNPVRLALGLDEHPKPRVGMVSREAASAIVKGLRRDAGATGEEAANVWIAEAADLALLPEARDFRRLVDHAIEVGATDISMQPQESGDYHVFIRRNGVLVEPTSVSGQWNATLASKAVSLLQLRSGANPTGAEQRKPTDGQLTYVSAAGEAFMRLNFIPLNKLGASRNFQSVSIRVMRREKRALSLASTNLDPETIAEITRAIKRSNGLIIVVGPTNSGKSSTIAAALHDHVQLYGSEQKRLSMEDPVEREVDGVTQIQVPPASLFATNAASIYEQEEARWLSLVRAVKRHDPDVLWVGEARDRVTAELAVEVAVTGHLSLTTLHAKDSQEAYDVLLQKIPADRRYQASESISLIVAQRMVNRLCPHCRVVRAPTEREAGEFAAHLEYLGEEAQLPAEIAFPHPDGCPSCKHQGSVGLIPLSEALPFTRPVKDAAIQLMTGRYGNRKALAGARRITLLQSAIRRLSRHEITLADVLMG